VASMEVGTWRKRRLGSRSSWISFLEVLCTRLRERSSEKN
jgi:hypothetical protein